MLSHISDVYAGCRYSCLSPHPRPGIVARGCFCVRRFMLRLHQPCTICTYRISEELFMPTHSNTRRQARLAASNQHEPSVSLTAVNWRRLFSYLRPYRWRMALAVLALLLSSGLGLAFPLVIVRLLESVT